MASKARLNDLIVRLRTYHEGAPVEAADEIVRLREENARLRAALNRYGEHGEGCPAEYRSIGDAEDKAENPCLCGLETARALAEGGH